MIVIVLTGLALILLIVTVVLVRQTGRLGARFAAITRGSEERSLEAVLEAHLARVDLVAAELDRIEAHTVSLDRALKRSISRVGLVRYNPFEDTGGNQSFALALLDSHGDGFVMSSLHARNQTRVYAKKVNAGQSDVALSEEEAAALRTALLPPRTTAEPE